MKELIYPSTYHAMKAGPCRVGVCKNDGKCGKCKEYGELRRYAARDTDRIQELRALVKELADDKRISDAVIQSMRDKKLEMAGEIADKDEGIARLRALVKELSNVAERFVSCKATYCEIACRDIKEKCIHKKTIELVAKAREAIGGTK